jgi:hypothetical protein
LSVDFPSTSEVAVRLDLILEVASKPVTTSSSWASAPLSAAWLSGMK